MGTHRADRLGWDGWYGSCRGYNGRLAAEAFVLGFAFENLLEVDSALFVEFDELHTHSRGGILPFILFSSPNNSSDALDERLL
jgi:hypothetical protein